MKKKWVMNFYQDFFVCAVMSATILLAAKGAFSAGDYGITLAESFLINYIAGILLPVDRWAEGFAIWIAKKETSWLFGVGKNFLASGVYTWIISMVMTWINNGYENYFAVWFSTFPILLVVSNVAGMIFAPVSRRLAEKMVR